MKGLFYMLDIKRKMANFLTKSIQFLSSLPYVRLILHLLPKKHQVEINKNDDRSIWLIRLESIFQLFVTSCARYAGAVRPIFSECTFKIAAGAKAEWTMRLNICEYTQCGYFVGHVSRPLLRLIQETGNGHNTCLDIGANVGLYSLAASRFFGQVISFEPNPRTLPLLHQNIQYSQADNITVFPVGLADKVDKIKLLTDPVNQGGSRIWLPKNQDEALGVNAETQDASAGLVDEGLVDVMTLDYYITNLQADVGKISLMKIDVEGLEALVIAGALHTISQHMPFLFVEVSEWPGVKAILDLLPEGYCAVEPSSNRKLTVELAKELPFDDVIFYPLSDQATERFIVI